MGGGGSRHVVHHQVVHHRPVEVVKQVEALKQQIQQAQKPQNIPQKVQDLKAKYWQDLKKQTFKVIDGKSIIFIGHTSVGKSSLHNTLFKTKLAVSKSSCTKQVQLVTKIGEVSIFDCPGFDQHFDIMKNPEKIPQYLGNMSVIYYLYDGLIEDDMIKTLQAMRKTFYVVRTKCDPDDDPAENPKVRAADKTKFQSLGYTGEIFLTSKKGGEDNEKLLKHILS